MSTFVDWEPNQKQGMGGSRKGFLKLENGKKYRVRLVSKALMYYQHFDPVICRSPGVDPASGQTIDPLMQMGYTPRKGYAIWVIDREDKQFKIMDFPQTLYDKFVEWKQAFNEDPGGVRGPDWQIMRDCPSGNKLQTKYHVIALDRVEFSDEEKTFIKANNLRAKLEDLRRSHTPEEIKEMLAKKQGGVAVKPPAGKPAQAAQTYVQAPPTAQPSAPAKADDFQF